MNNQNIKIKNPLELLSSNPVEISILTLKAKLMLIATQLIKDNEWTQKEAAHHLKTTQPRISNLINNQHSKFSIDMLLDILGRLNYRPDITFNLDDKDDTPIRISLRKTTI